MANETRRGGERKTRRAIVKLLKTEGPLGSAQLAERLGLTAMAVRLHLYALQGEGLVAAEEEGEGFLLVENHCPICAAANACQGFCSTELDLFRTVLGTGVEVELVEHIVSGDRRCAYRVTPEVGSRRRVSRQEPE